MSRIESSRIESNWRELVEAYLSGEATPGQCAELEALLASSEAARDYYLDYVNLHSALRRRFLLPQEEENGPAESPVSTNPAGRSWAGIGLAIVASGTLLAALLAFAFWPPSSHRDDRDATVRDVQGDVVRLSSSGQAVAKSGDLLRPGETLRVEGEDARAAIEYSDGTVIRIQSGSVVRSPVDREVRLDLLAGAMEVESVRLARDASVFTTEHSRYVAKDTRFRLYHDGTGSRLEIQQGKVRVERPDRGESVEVEAGSMAFAADATPVEVRPLAFGTAELSQTLRAAGQKVAFSADEQQLAASNWQNSLKLFELGKEQPRAEYSGDVGYAEALVLAADPERIVQVNRHGYILAWEPGQKAAVKLPFPGKHTRSRALSPEGSFAAESSEEGTTVYRLDFEDKALREVRTFGGPGKTWCLALSRDGQRLALGFWDGTVRVCDVASGEVVWERRLAHTPTLLDLTRGGEHLVVFTQKDGICQFDLATGEQRTLSEPGMGVARCLAFDASGKHVLAGLNDRTARMWSAEDGRQLLVIDAGHSPQGIAWSEKRQILVTADGDVKIWKCDLMRETIQ